MRFIRALLELAGKIPTAFVIPGLTGMIDAGLQFSGHVGIIDQYAQGFPALSLAPRLLAPAWSPAIAGWQRRWETREEWPRRARILRRRAPL
jgi:hypothetical protein